jgi:hypothetical protein
VSRTAVDELPATDDWHRAKPVSGELLELLPGTDFTSHRSVKVSLTIGTDQVAVKRSEPGSTLR